MQAHERVRTEVKVPDPQVGHFLHPRPGVVEEQQEGSVSQREPTPTGQVRQQIFDLVAFEEPGLGWSRTFGRDGGHPLADAEHLGVPRGDVVEQGVHRSESLVAGAGVVAAVFFEVSQESDDPIEAKIAGSQAGDPAALVGRGEYQQQPDRVAVAAHRGRAQTLDGDQVVDEKRLQQLTQRRG